MKFGGRLRFFLKFWRTFCHDPAVLDIIKGIKVDFINGTCPVQHSFPRPFHMSQEETKAMDELVFTLLKTGCIATTSKPLPGKGWMNNMFLVRKKCGKKFRGILDLKLFNENVKFVHFRLDQVSKALDMVRINDYFGSLDLIQAYQHVYVNESFQEYFVFSWNNVFYKWVTLSQGFQDSPRLFCRLTSALTAYLRRNLIDILIYIDDSFLRASFYEVCARNIDFTRQFFEQCGFTVNIEKSILVPTQCIEFLGFIIDSVSYSVRVTDTKRLRFQKLIREVLKKPRQKMTIKFIARLVGIIVSFFPASHHAKLHYCTLDRYKVEMVRLHKRWSARVMLSKDCTTELKWWSDNICEKLLTKSLHPPHATQIIFTDSSGQGYGSKWEGRTHQALFSEKQKNLHINDKELLAVYYTLLLYGPELRSEVVHIRCDNMSVVHSIQSLGSSKLLRDRIVGKIYSLCDEFNFKIVISYVKSKENVSDVLS